MILRREMLPVFARMLALLLGVGLALAGSGLLGTLLAVRLSDAGFGPLPAAAILSAYFAGSVASALGAHRTIQSVGHIRVFAAFAALLAMTTLAHGLLPPSGTWALLRLLAGICVAGLFVVVESWLNAGATNETRGRVLSAYMVSVYLGLGLGQLLLNAWPIDRIELFCVAAMLFSLAVVPVALTRTAAPVLESPDRLPLRTLFARAPLGPAAALVGGVLAACIYALVPLYGRSMGFGPREVSVVMSSLILGGLLLQWPLGRLSDRNADRRRVLGAVALALVPASALLALERGPSLTALCASGALFGGLVFSLYPLAVAHTFDRFGSEQALQAASQLLLASAVGAVLGPLGAAVVMTALGAPGLFVFAGVVSLALAGGIHWRIRRVDPVSEAERAVYVALPRTTAGALALHPHTEDAATGGRRRARWRPRWSVRDRLRRAV